MLKHKDDFCTVLPEVTVAQLAAVYVPREVAERMKEEKSLQVRMYRHRELTDCALINYENRRYAVPHRYLIGVKKEAKTLQPWQTS